MTVNWILCLIISSCSVRQSGFEDLKARKFLLLPKDTKHCMENFKSSWYGFLLCPSFIQTFFPFWQHTVLLSLNKHFKTQCWLKSKHASKFRLPRPLQNLFSNLHRVARNKLSEDSDGQKWLLYQKKSDIKYCYNSIMFWVYPHKWSQLNFQRPSIINRHRTDGHMEMTRSQVPCPRLYLPQWEFIPANVEPGHVTRSSVHCPYMTLPLTKKHWLKWSHFTWCFWESVRSNRHGHSPGGGAGASRYHLPTK